MNHINMQHQQPSSESNQQPTFRIRTTTSTTTTSTIIITSHHHHHHPLQTNQSTLTPRTSSLPTIHLTPLLTLAAYGSIIITAFSALFGLVFTSYGLFAWGDVKDKFIGTRGMAARRSEATNEILGLRPLAALPRTEFATRTHFPRRPIASRSSSSHDSRLIRACPSKMTFPRTGYDATSENLEDIDIGSSSEELRRRRRQRSRSSGDRYSQPTQPPPRPTLSVLIASLLFTLVASLLFTLVVVTGRLMVAWWMGQQTQKNSPLAPRNAQRAYKTAQQDDQDLVDHVDDNSDSSPHPLPSTRNKIQEIDRFSF